MSTQGSFLLGETNVQIQEYAASSAAAAKSLQLCRTLCNPTDGSPPGSPIPGILQARTLEWVAISFSNYKVLFFLYYLQIRKRRHRKEK